MKSLFLTGAFAIAISGAAIAGPGHSHGKAQTKKATLICPVTGDKIASAKAAAGHSTYKGKTYYFCCAGCKPRFDKNPAQITKNARAGRYEKM